MVIFIIAIDVIIIDFINFAHRPNHRPYVNRCHHHQWQFLRRCHYCRRHSLWDQVWQHYVVPANLAIIARYLNVFRI